MTATPEKRPVGNGWIDLRTWAALTGTPWERALEYANPKCKRTASMFHAADLDRRSSRDIKVWYQAPHPLTGFRRPRLVRRSVHQVGQGEQLEV